MVFVQRDGSESRKLTHNNDVCVACGICTDCCPTDSLSLNDVLAIKRGKAEGDYLSIDGDTCVLCGLCASSCAFGALSFEIGGVDIKLAEQALRLASAKLPVLTKIAFRPTQA